ncbi:type VII secretion target [Actinoplanes sp. TRM 88003]|uniref:Type VII secretion target n=1 Tax=Paractinoplanes aksuensis TaxID=2939490 RepID=A0ABT1E309_9ACTN|nr:type VII secretion target [Actinoplanes aksuensis]MCO8277512.1 type VII secretion target [Actinoplanes aksuensis]
MTGEAVRMPIDAVRRHAGSVDAVADAVGEAKAAVGQVTMDTQAYGQLCQFLPGLLEPAFSAALDALSESGDGLRETAIGLRAVADQAAATDRSSADRVTTAGTPAGGLPRLPL